MTVHILPKEQADKYPQGIGREELNSDPYCPPVDKRFKLTWNPVLTFYKLYVTEEMKKKFIKKAI